MSSPSPKVVLVACLCVFAAACLSRPIVSENPTTLRMIDVPIAQDRVDKVDLLFAIDNSASMGDKQQLLADAVPLLVGRLLEPNCVATDPNLACASASDCASLGASAQCDTSKSLGVCFVPGSMATCPTGTKAEFPAVHDMHIGIVSSSLGGGGGDVCAEQAGDPTHQNDRGHLLNRTKGTPEGSIPNAAPLDGSGGDFLAWLPSSNPANAGKPDPNVTKYVEGQQSALVADFQKLVTGVQETGCGLEAQLESWYRFLIQPDPYDAIVLGGSGVSPVQLQGVDATLLKMRHDFLRPDSLVAIIQLTDEEDSWSDPLWGGGYGWTVRTHSFPGGPKDVGVGPRGTSECDTNPNDPDCTSCAFTGNKPASGAPISADPSCTSCAGGLASCLQKGWYTPQQDGLNVRYTDDMKRRYGLAPQWSVQRYVDGLRLPLVPDRDGEVHDASQYASTQRSCTNPLYAASLPDGSDTGHDTLCELPPGARTPDLVFYAIIGGVPTSLLYDPSGAFKSNLSGGDWTKILGADPEHFDQTGVDPHMIESIGPRPGLETPGATYSLGSDPDHGREWNTLTSSAGIDLQYACTFALPAPRDCTLSPEACDCTGAATTSADGPPLCDPTTRTTQVRGKAYPTVRELRVAKALGAQAVVASLCARDTNPAHAGLPSYGYNPAMQAIANRLGAEISVQCMPSDLKVQSDCSVPCQVLVEYRNQTDQAAGCKDPGMSQPDPATLSRFQQQWQARQGDAGVSQPPPVVCVLQQLEGGSGSSVAVSSGCSSASPGYQGASCAADPSASAGWCYVVGVANTGGCPQAIEFAGAGPPSGTTVHLECIEN